MKRENCGENQRKEIEEKTQLGELHHR